MDRVTQNQKRAAAAVIALDSFQSHVQCDADDVLRDLLTDLLHWCDANQVDFDFELRSARRAHEEEEVCDVRHERSGA